MAYSPKLSFSVYVDGVVDATFRYRTSATSWADMVREQSKPPVMVRVMNNRTDTWVGAE